MRRLPSATGSRLSVFAEFVRRRFLENQRILRRRRPGFENERRPGGKSQVARVPIAEVDGLKHGNSSIRARLYEFPVELAPTSNTEAATPPKRLLKATKCLDCRRPCRGVGILQGDIRAIFNPNDHSAPSYSTECRNSPRAGAVGPAAARARAAIIAGIRVACRRPRPTSSWVPTRLRTMWCKKPLPRTR